MVLPCDFYYIVSTVVTAGGGCGVWFGETSSVYNGASPSDESFEPLCLASEISC